jgi:hypothetical protein
VPPLPHTHAVLEAWRADAGLFAPVPTRGIIWIAHIIAGAVRLSAGRGSIAAGHAAVTA